MSEKRALAAALLLAVPAALLAFPSVARGTVGGSPHDLVAQGYGTATEEDSLNQCGPCHMPIGEREWDFLKTVPPSLSGFDARSLACYSCHDGTTFVSPEVDASGTAFHPLSHGYDIKDYPGVPAEAYELVGIEEKKMSCLTCHDPHDDSYRPFLRDGLDALCQVCHENMVGEERNANRRGVNHPILVNPVESRNDAIPLTITSPFRVPFPATYPLQGGKDADGVHWNLGGHLEEGTDGRTLCATCHAVHGDEVEPPSEYLLTVDPVREWADMFCEGCHRGERGDGLATPYFPNPGGTTEARTYHPCDDDEGNGSDRIIEIEEPAGIPFGTALSRPLLCTSCHRAHNAREDSSLLRVREGSLCGTCHLEMPLAYHHPAGDVETGPCLEAMVRPDDEEEDTTAGILCEDCHRAHNAGLGTGREEDFVPILREPIDSIELCSRCHPEDNPTCLTDAQGKASHFLGDPTLPETYGNPDPPLYREPWPESGLPSLYGGENAMAITCLTCHAFKKSAVGEEGPVADEGTGEGETAVVRRHLVARAGGTVEWDSSEEEMAYLCTGCHSGAPGTKGSGKTHPLMEAQIPEDMVVAPPVTVTPEGRVNCDSCHRSHGARTAGGVYMLEEVSGSNTDARAIHPAIDFTVLCHKCHNPKDY